MTAALTPVHAGAAAANESLKARFPASLWRSILLATLCHFLIFAFWPMMTAPALGNEARPAEVIDLTRAPEIPPPPDEVRRPAVPIASPDLEIDPELTIPPTVFPDGPPAGLPDPPAGAGVDVSARPVFTPHEVDPEFRNAAEYLRVLERRYPSMLREAGVGGTTVLWVFIDETGAVRNTRVETSSGHGELDAVAERVMMEVARFRPALNRDQRVPVWVRIPVTFTVR